MVTQAFLVRANRLDLHRWLGKASVVVVGLFLFTALQVMKHFYEKGIAQWPRETVLSLLAQSFTGLCLFAVFYFLAVLKRSNLHQRVAFMVAAVLAAATPGLARLGLYLVGGLPGILLVIALIYVTLLPDSCCMRSSGWVSPCAEPVPADHRALHHGQRDGPFRQPDRRLAMGGGHDCFCLVNALRAAAALAAEGGPRRPSVRSPG